MEIVYYHTKIYEYGQNISAYMAIGIIRYRGVYVALKSTSEKRSEELVKLGWVRGTV